MIPANQIFEVEWRVLRALNGWQLKAYILLRNSQNPLTCSEIAEAFGTESRNVWLALNQLVERYYLTRQDGKYFIAKFGGTPLANSISHESSIPHEEKFPHTPLKENPCGVSANCARTHSHDFDFYVSSLTDDPSLTSLAAEFLSGEIKRGENLEARGIPDLKRHFTNWLPKFQAKQEIAARQQQRSSEQDDIKAAREADSDALQRKYDADLRASQTPEALAEGARVLAKFTKA